MNGWEAERAKKLGLCEEYISRSASAFQMLVKLLTIRQRNENLVKSIGNELRKMNLGK